MRDKTISATAAARSFSEVLNQVQYRDTSFSIERGGKVVARLVPPALPAGLPLADLNHLFAGLSHLGSSEASQWRAEVRSMKRARRRAAVAFECLNDAEVDVVLDNGQHKSLSGLQLPRGHEEAKMPTSSPYRPRAGRREIRR